MPLRANEAERPLCVSGLTISKSSWITRARQQDQFVNEIFQLDNWNQVRKVHDMIYGMMFRYFLVSFSIWFERLSCLEAEFLVDMVKSFEKRIFFYDYKSTFKFEDLSTLSVTKDEKLCFLIEAKF